MLIASRSDAALLAYLKGVFQVVRGICDLLEVTDPDQPGLLANRVRMEYERGDFDKGAASLERFLDLASRYPPGPSVMATAPAFVAPLVARVTGDLDRLEVAKVAAESVLSSPTATPLVIRLARTGLGIMAVLQSDIEEANRQRTALEPARGTITAPGHLAADHLLGLLAHTMCNQDLAVGHFEDSLSFCRRGGFRPELVWTCCDYADTLIQRGEPGDREKAMSLLDESLAISRELGMRPLMERVMSRREILKA